MFIALFVTNILVVLLGSSGEDGLFFVAVAGYAVVGALVAARQPANAIGWILLATGIALTVGSLADANLLSRTAPARGLSAWL